MKCKFCGKHIDEIDCSCKMCTICGWALDLLDLKGLAPKESAPPLPATG